MTSKFLKMELKKILKRPWYKELKWWVIILAGIIGAGWGASQMLNFKISLDISKRKNSQQQSGNQENAVQIQGDNSNVTINNKDQKSAELSDEIKSIIADVKQLSDDGKYDDAESLLNNYIQIWAPNVTELFYRLGKVNKLRGNYDKTIEFYKICLAIDKKIYGEIHSEIAIDHTNLGSVYTSKGLFHKSIAYTQKALEMELGLPEKDTSAIAARLNNLGYAYDGLGDLKTALQYFESAYNLANEIWGIEDQRLIIVENKIDELKMKIKKSESNKKK